MTETEDCFRDCDANEVLAQIGRPNVLAISGGRVLVRPTGVTLPVGSGYMVTVDLAANDTYTVRRVFRRGAKTWIKGEMTEVYFNELSEIAYQASSYRSYEFPKPEPSCRVCGCTETRACVRTTPIWRETCAWAEPDLCTACAPDAGDGWRHPSLDGAGVT